MVLNNKYIIENDFEVLVENNSQANIENYQVFLPFVHMSNLIGVKVVENFKDKSFVLDGELTKQKNIVKELISKNPKVFFFHNDVLYLEMSSFAHYYPIGLDLNMSKLRLYLNVKQLGVFFRKYEDPLSYKNIYKNQDDLGKIETAQFKKKSFSLDQELSFSDSKFKSQNTLATSVGRFDHRLEVMNKSIEKYSIYRKSLEPFSFFGVKATEVNLLSSSVPYLPYIGGGGAAKGMLIKKTSNSFTTNLDDLSLSSETIWGVKGKGWVIDLVQNDSFIERVETAEDGRFEFKNIKLFYGNNRFVLTFYGPKGELYQETFSYNVDSETFSNNDLRYEVFVGTGSNGSVTVTKFQRKLINNMFSRISFLDSYSLSRKKRIRYGEIHTSSFFKNLNVDYSIVHENFDYFYSVLLLKSQILGQPLTFSYDKNFNNFQDSIISSSELMVREKVGVYTDFSFDNFKSLQNRFLFERKSLLNEKDFNSKYLFSTSANKNSFVFGNEIGFNDESNDFIFKQSIRRIMHDVSFTASVTEKKNMILDSSSFFLNWRISELYDFGFNFYQNFQEKLSSLRINSNFNFKYFLMNSGVNLIKDKISYDFTLNWNISPDSNLDYKFKVGNIDSNSVAVAQVYLDSNYNNRKEIDEIGLVNVLLKVNNSDEEFITNEKGEVVLSRLKSYSINKVTIAEDSLEDLSYKVNYNYSRFYIRPGMLNFLNIPIQKFYEIYGDIKLTNKKDNCSLILFNDFFRQEIKKIKAIDKYSFESLQAGTYNLHLICSPAKEMHIKIELKDDSLKQDIEF